MSNSMSSLDDLRQKAELIYHKRLELDQSMHHTSNKELVLHQLEVEIQHENLRETNIQLQDSCNKYYNLYHSAPVGYFSLNSAGLITDVNQAGVDLLGINRDALLQRCFSRYIAADTQLLFSSCRQSLLKKQVESQSCMVKLIRKNGLIAHVHLEILKTNNPVTNETELLICATNISKIKLDEHGNQSQFKVTKNERLSINMDLTLTMIHELNHPLCVINNYLHGCMRRMEKGKFELTDIQHGIKQALLQSNRAAELMLRMKELTTRSNYIFEKVNMDLLMKETIELIPNEIADIPINIRYRSSSNMPQVTLDKTYIQQVILNLARNSIEAIRDAQITDPRLTIDVHSGGKDFIEIRLLDNGPGIDPVVLQKLFTPHFTTKTYGIGLGLILSRSIIEAHGGQLQINANPTGGTCISFTISTNLTSNE